MSVLLPVSIGEALDKLTILNIKLENISDERRNHVQHEYDILYDKLKEYVEKFPVHYTMLKDVNSHIYRIQDEIRYKKDVLSKEQHSQYCIQVLDVNDGRFRVKNKINHLLNSQIREQKGYKKTKCFLLCHLGLGDMILMNGAVRYLSMMYDEVHVVCKKKYVSNVELFYQDDPNIILIEVDDDKDISPMYGASNQIFLEKTKDYNDVYLIGYHNPINYNKMIDFPNQFYKELGLEPNLRKKYFFIQDMKDNLFELVKDREYIVVHDQSSNLTDKRISERLMNKNKLVINLNRNLYEKEHPDYELTNHFVNCKIAEYKKLIENASELHFIDSCVFCFSTHLNLEKVKVKVCYIRDPFTIPYAESSGFQTAQI